MSDNTGLIDLHTLPPVNILRRSGWQLELPVHGRSMEPLLHESDQVSVVCGSLSELRAGNVACFRRFDAFVIHRLIKQSADGRWYEKGDAEAGGTWVDPEEILGRVTHLNGRALSARAEFLAFHVSRAEWRLESVLRRLRLPRLPVRGAMLWRRVKSLVHTKER